MILRKKEINMESEQYGNFIDIETCYPSNYPDNLRQMKKKYNIPNNHFAYKKYNIFCNVNFHVLRTIPEYDDDYFKNKSLSISNVNNKQNICTNIYNYLLLYILFICFISLFLVYCFIHYNLM